MTAEADQKEPPFFKRTGLTQIFLTTATTVASAIATGERVSKLKPTGVMVGGFLATMAAKKTAELGMGRALGLPSTEGRSVVSLAKSLAVAALTEWVVRTPSLAESVAARLASVGTNRLPNPKQD